MNVRFHSIRLKRFRSYLEESTLLFSSAGFGLYFLKGKNNTALGSNGAGKSSIVDALMWCLYGRTVKGLRNTDVAPWSGKGTTEVEVVVFVDKTKHSIKRTISPNLLTIDGKEAGQEYVDKLIQIPLEVLPYTVVMGQHQDLFFDLTSSEALKVFNCLGLDRWEYRAAHAAEQVKTLDIEIEAKIGELVSFKHLLTRCNSEIERLRNEQQVWEQRRAELLDTKETEKKKLQGQIDKILKERDTADLKLDRAETELRALRPALERLASAERVAGQASVKAQNSYNSLYLEKQHLETDVESIDEGICPTCEQPLKTHKLEKNTKARLAELKGEIDKAVKALKTSEELYELAEKAYYAQIEAQGVFEKEAEEARDVLDRLLPQIAGWEAQIKALDSVSEEYLSQDNPYKGQVMMARKYLAETKEKQEKAEESINTKKQYSERLRFWAKAFKDIKLYTLEEILQELEITTNSMCDEFGLTGWRVEYDIERETKSGTISRGLNITVRSPANKQAVKWGVWSGGEGQRLKLIGSAALSSVLLNHVGVTTNLAVFDEPTESLSKEGVQDLVELLYNQAKDRKMNIWLIDHHTIESQRFAQIITVTKTKSGSVLDV